VSVATAAGIATLTALQREGVWDGVAAQAQKLVDGLNSAATDAGVPFNATAVGTMAGFFFTDQPVRNYDDAKQADTVMFGRFFDALIDRGVYFAPSAFESLFLSSAHSDQDIEKTIAAAAEAFKMAKS
jgi:glutamate-1-semialdehyde 2,1-aminomutase